MKKILVIALAALMLAVMAVPAFAAQTAFVEVASFDFSDTEGLKGYTASWVGDNKCNAAASEVLDGAIVDGQFVMGTMAFIMDETVDASKGIKITMDATLDLNKISGQPWWQAIVSVVDPDGKADQFLALSGEEFEQSFDTYYLNLQGGGKNFQVHTGALNDETLGNDVVWGGDAADIISEEEPVKTFAVEFIIVPNDAQGADVTIKVDGEAIELPNNPEFANYLSETALVTIGGTHYSDYPANVTVDNVVVYTMQEVEEGSAPVTGVATIALAIAAIASGAYIVSKKH